MAATPEETLADEQRRRIPAAIAAIAAGVLSLVASILHSATYADFPAITVIRALQERLEGARLAPPGLKARQALYDNDHALQLLAEAFVLALSIVAIGIALTYLYRATAARAPNVGRAAIVVAIAGTVLVALPGLVKAIALAIDAKSFADMPVAEQSAEAARDVVSSPVGIAAEFLGQFGRLLLGLAIVLGSLKAMGVGLLTRFMGVLGIIVGVLFILSFGSILPLVQAFWFIALGALFLGKWGGPQGLPPAWSSGEAHPWPTQQELREARLERQAERSGARAESKSARRGEVAERDEQEPAPTNAKGRGRPSVPKTPAPQAPARPAHSSSKKKKRKRR